MNKGMLLKPLKIINQHTENFKQHENVAQIVSQRYNQELSDVEEWLSITEWSQDLISEDTLLEVQNQLYDLDIISERIDYKSLTYKL